MILQGKAWIFGDEINTDIIIPSQYAALPADEYKKHIMEAIRPGFHSMIQEGDFIFAGKQFGIGSSRGQAIAGISEAGIRAIVAASFGRIFYRSAINEGLPAILCPEAVTQTKEGDAVQIDLASCTILNKSTGTELHFQPFPDLVYRIIMAGGGVKYYRESLKVRRDVMEGES
jgi:3-isopropylmalate/(R)-2-methylmalate dehydratase small subunit